MDAAYRLWDNVLAPALADRRHDGLGLQKLLIVALHDTRVDIRHFQRADKRVDVILYEGDVGRIGRHGPVGLTVYGDILFQKLLHGDAFRYSQGSCGFLVLNLFLSFMGFRLSLRAA